MNNFNGETIGVKPGTSNFENIPQIGQEVSSLVHKGKKVIITTSGAIEMGMKEVGVTERPDKDTEEGMSELQYFAGVGWPNLANAWKQALPDLNVCSMLLTRQELQNGASDPLFEAMNTMEAAFRNNGVVLTNENDPIAHEEIAFGNNDILAALILVQRKLVLNEPTKLVILTDVDGLLEDKDDPSSLIRVVDDIASIKKFARGTSDPRGTGGMTTKVEAAEMATVNDIDTYLANGNEPNAIRRAISGEIGTHFVAKVAEVF